MFHTSHSLYAPGDTVGPGNWGRVLLGYGASHNRFFPEYVFERIRAAEFTDKPSRLHCCFAFEELALAEQYARLNSPLEIVYEVEPTEPNASQHRGDMTWIETPTMHQCHTFDGVEELARRYWRGMEHAERKIELVIRSPLVILRRCTPFADDPQP